MHSLLIHNAVIFGNPDCSAVLCEDGVITALLNEPQAEKVACECRLNAKGNLLLPSFFDSHIHLSEYGLRLNRLNLNGKSLAESLQLIGDKVRQTPKGAWIMGGGWHKTYFGELPTRKLLDEISTEHFIALSSQDFHAVWANTPAITCLNEEHFSSEELPKDNEGNFTGIALERAALSLASMAKVSVAEMASAIQFAQSKLFELGITDVFTIEKADALPAFLELGDDLKLRVKTAVYVESLSSAKEFLKANPIKNLSLNAVKLFIDGSLGAETCAMLEPFENTSNFGISLYADADILKLFKMIEREGLNIAVHAIGDRAVRRALNAFEKIAFEKIAFEKNGATQRPRFRHRIEHAQMIHDDDLHRFAKLGIIASMQPIHIREDIATARRLLGKRQSKLYRFKSLLKTGAMLIFGSDAPIETPNVFEGLYYAVVRCDEENQTWYGDERVSFEDALRAYTETPNLLMNTSNRGRLEVGYTADMVIVQKDFFSELIQSKASQSVLATVSSGEVVFENL